MEGGQREKQTEGAGREKCLRGAGKWEFIHRQLIGASNIPPPEDQRGVAACTNHSRRAWCNNKGAGRDVGRARLELGAGFIGAINAR